MVLGRSLHKKYFFLFFTFLLILAKPGNAVINVKNSFVVHAQVQDTVEIDTVGPLPYPFEDQPAFGSSKSDSLKLFLNKPSNIKYEVEYDPITGQYVIYEKVGTLNYRLPQTMSLDDYIDYDFESKLMGNGLFNIKERCKVINGNCNVSSNSNGTEFKISVKNSSPPQAKILGSFEYTRVDISII